MYFAWRQEAAKSHHQKFILGNHIKGVQQAKQAALLRTWSAYAEERVKTHHVIAMHQAKLNLKCLKRMLIDWRDYVAYKSHMKHVWMVNFSSSWQLYPSLSMILAC